MGKKVLMIADKLTSGGIASAIKSIAHYCNKYYGIQFDFITYCKLDLETEIYLSDHGFNNYTVKRLSETSLTQYVSSIRRIIRDRGPYDVIHSHTSYLIWISHIAAYLEGIKIRIGHAHGSKSKNSNLTFSIVEKVGRIMNRKLATDLLTCSQKSAMYTFGKEAVFIPNIVNIDMLTKVDDMDYLAYNREFQIEPSTKILGFFGYLGGEKNPLFAINIIEEMIKKNQDIVLLMAGKGDMENEIINYISANKLDKNVRILGYRNDIFNLLKYVDITLLPSYSEGMSMICLESQIVGTPIIVSKGVPKTNDLKIGLMKNCETYDLSEWIESINKFFSKKQSISDISRRIKRIEEIGYDSHSVASKLHNIYYK